MSTTPKRILVLSATELEMMSLENYQADSLVTRIGMVATTHALTSKLAASHFDLVINIGVAGSFNSKLEIGSVVQVISDRIVELGVEDNGKFIPANEMNLCQTEALFFESELRIEKLPTANGITVNRVHGTKETIEKVVAQFNPDIETMEGAAVAYVCKQFNTPWVQLRVISNKVEPRNRDNWNIPLALKNLHSALHTYLQQIENEA